MHLNKQSALHRTTSLVEAPYELYNHSCLTYSCSLSISPTTLVHLYTKLHSWSTTARISDQARSLAKRLPKEKKLALATPPEAGSGALATVAGTLLALSIMV